MGIPRSAQATKVGMLTDSRVAQYCDALSAVKDELQNAPGLEVSAPDYAAIGRQAAKLAADWAAKSPESRFPRPAASASPGVLTVNAKTARRLGPEGPADVQSKAKQVYR